MRRVIVTALALAVLPVAAFAQTPPTQPPAQQPPAQTAPAAPAQPAAPQVSFKSAAGILLVQIKADQTAAFEDMMAKLKPALTASSDAALKQQASFKVYKSTDPSPSGNALYVVVFDPATPGVEYSFLAMFNKTLTPEQQRDPATVESFKTWAASFAGMNILNLTPVGGGM
jgi:hypothetical protein